MKNFDDGKKNLSSYSHELPRHTILTFSMYYAIEKITRDYANLSYSSLLNILIDRNK